MISKRKLAILEIWFHIINTVTCIGLMYYLEGFYSALSSYAQFDSTVFIFKYWVFILAFGGVRSPKLKYAAFPLIGIALFDSCSEISAIQIAHDIFAIMFFVVVGATFLRSKRKFERVLGWIMLCGSPLAYFSLYFAEITVILILIIYLISVSKCLWDHEKRIKKGIY